MVMLLEAFEVVTVALGGFFFLYLATLSLLALSRKENTAFSARHERRFVVVVPAHNEEHMIEPTLRNLQRLEYPKDLFEIIVIADNCSDATAVVAQKTGVTVFVRAEPRLHGKGYALRWCFDRLIPKAKDFEAVVVVDADSVVSSNFLSVMNHYLDSGAKAIQSSDLAAHAPGDWSLEMTRFSFLLHNLVRPLGRSVLGCSAGLKGNGMCFLLQTLIDVPWDSYSTNEDLEYGMKLLLSGIPVIFAPEAKVHATMPLTSANAESQRARWEKGRLPVIKRYALNLLSASIRKQSFALFDAFVELILPSLVNIGVFSFIMCILSFGLLALGLQEMRLFGLLWIIILVLGGLHAVIGLMAAKVGASAILTVRHIPKYFFWKLRIYTGQLGTAPSHHWVRTTRESSVGPINHKDTLQIGDSRQLSMSEERKCEVLFVSAPFSGVEVYLRNLHDAVRQCDDISSSWIWIDRHPKGFTAHIPRLNWSVKASIVASRRIRTLENSGKQFDLAFFNHLTPFTLLMRFRKRVPTAISLDATPVLLREYNEWYQLGQETCRPKWVNRITKALTRKSYNDATLIVAWSAKVKESLIRDYKVDPEKIRIIPPGVDLAVWTKRPRRDGEVRRSKHRISLLFVGGDFLRKGGDLLLKISQERFFHNCDFHFVTSSFSGALSANIFVHENVKANSEEMLSLYHNADIAVLPTHADFTPLAICEAMAMELPVVSTNVGNIGEMVIDGQTGFLIPPDDLDSLRESLNKLVSNAKLRRELGRNGRDLAESRFSVEKNSKELIENLKAVSKQK